MSFLVGKYKDKVFKKSDSYLFIKYCEVEDNGVMKIKLHQLINHAQTETVHYLLAKYLLANINDINHLSINKVVEDTLISKTSVLKFCNYFGYDSWKQFCNNLQAEYLMEQQRLASLKMNAKLMFIKDSLKDYLKLKDEFFYEVEKTITYSKIKKFARELYKADKVFIIGEICEISLFYELQDILSYNQKKVILPRYLNKKDFDSQINNIDQETLIIVCDGLHCYQDFIYYSSINSGYDHSSLFRNNKKIFIGQKSNIQSDDLITFELPFSFNEYFIRLAITDFIYKTITYYLYRYCDDNK
ncbi:hypothetical protein IMSAGC017_00713 [Thomasclavelia cocleata]|uniref:HTH rpiR-type domain-containing protein n=2 Tax=Thomasclavelia cocleata TaxID=69824 RepID=A0A829ZBB4_9FIRM|nr:hypothetical protein IMSAGC017_00713 [Thomasclavelia cocleata]